MTQNPWENIPLSIYEAHMALPQIQQLSKLRESMADQFRAYPVKTAAVWGIAGGNGLELVPETIQTLHGIDVNVFYLNACARRFPSLRDRLVLHHIDMTDEDASFPKTELVIANLFVEYLGVPLFVRQIRRGNPRCLSCIIQKNAGDSMVSSSPYTASFGGLASPSTGRFPRNP